MQTGAREAWAQETREAENAYANGSYSSRGTCPNLALQQRGNTDLQVYEAGKVSKYPASSTV
jgi:hypothetical protein